MRETGRLVGGCAAERHCSKPLVGRAQRRNTLMEKTLRGWSEEAVKALGSLDTSELNTSVTSHHHSLGLMAEVSPVVDSKHSCRHRLRFECLNLQNQSQVLFSLKYSFVSVSFFSFSCQLSSVIHLFRFLMLL